MPGDREPGWYPDPDGLPADRWFDGTQWTARVTTSGPSTAAPAEAATAPDFRKGHGGAMVPRSPRPAWVKTAVPAVLGLVIAIVIVAVVFGNRDTATDRRQDATARADVTRGVTAIRSCAAAMAGRLPASASSSVQILTLRCGGDQRFLQIARNEAAVYRQTGPTFTYAITSASDHVFTYDSGTGKISRSD